MAVHELDRTAATQLHGILENTEPGQAAEQAVEKLRARLLESRRDLIETGAHNGDTRGRESAYRIVEQAIRDLNVAGPPKAQVQTRETGRTKAGREYRLVATGTSRDQKGVLQVYRRDRRNEEALAESEERWGTRDQFARCRLVDEIWYVLAGSTVRDTKETREDAERWMYKEIAGLEQQPRATPETIGRAAELGVRLTPPAKKLARWSPDMREESALTQRAEPGPHAMVVGTDLTAAEREMLWHTAAGVEDRAHDLFMAVPGLKGHAWYDALTPIEALRVTCTDGNNTWTLGQGPTRVERGQVDRITVQLLCEAPDAGANGRAEQADTEWESDIAIDIENEGKALPDFAVHAKRGVDIPTDELTQMVTNVWNEGHTASDQGRYELHRLARRHCLTMVESAEEATRDAIEETVRREIVPELGRLTRRQGVTIKARSDAEVSVRLDRAFRLDT